MGLVTKHRQKRRQAGGKPGAFRLGAVDNYTYDYRPRTPQYSPGLTPVRVWADGPAVARLQDHWDWPYPPANQQVIVLNGWDGNQLPGQEREPWVHGYNMADAHATQQDQNPGRIDGQYRGLFGQQMSQIETQDVLKQISGAWQRVRGGGL